MTVKLFISVHECNVTVSCLNIINLYDNYFTIIILVKIILSVCIKLNNRKCYNNNSLA